MNNIQSTFVVGDKWLYYKIYCGVKTADIILLEVIKPLTEDLIAQKIIDKWFFIRYSDPEPHLRFRIKLLDINYLGKVLITVKNILNPFLTNKQVWDVQLGTYQRELERYGNNTIENAEIFFHFDSKLIIEVIKNAKNDEDRFLNIFKWLECLINSFNFTDDDAILFLDRMQKQFKEEFDVEKTIRKELSSKYRRLESLLLVENNFNLSEKTQLKEIMERLLMLEKEEKLHVSINNLLASFIHMSINRCFRSKQRLYEMMLYDFLFRKYKSEYIRYGNK
ncbi:thiopeptide-type bacteriocin biosynthesis protein [Polaribacter batillariae]|uniref:Thiopeptide-type bacteriocin biosynthesis protein n=1 Tax=Polaribacter batillariae TaxID=2808900 RepID=A0ABX7ST54_9FLAO|nr:thiopeptide-type bacteriocin biosynthesis protein [Polaribacter batillariae]QTD36726.1 thiopeptide-type bacteriocin biosynthesis protein [Polaribacter batillariae]